MSGKEYRTITDVKGPLVFLNKTEPVSYGEIVQLMLSDGSIKNGQVLIHPTTKSSYKFSKALHLSIGRPVSSSWGMFSSSL